MRASRPDLCPKVMRGSAHCTCLVEQDVVDRIWNSMWFSVESCIGRDPWVVRMIRIVDACMLDPE